MDAGAACDGDVHADAYVDAGRCLDTLDHVRNTFGGATDAGTACPDTAGEGIGLIEAGVPCNYDLFTSSCGDLKVFGRTWGTHALYCFYPADGGTLVGATANDDQPSFCAHTSYTISAGSAEEESNTGGLSWSVSGQSCAIVTPTYGACPHDASAD